MHAANVVCNVSMICLNDSLCQALGQWRRAKKRASSEKAGERKTAFFPPVCFLDPFFQLLLEPTTGYLNKKNFFFKRQTIVAFRTLVLASRKKNKQQSTITTCSNYPRRQARENECGQIPFFRFYSRWLKNWLEFC